MSPKKHERSGYSFYAAMVMFSASVAIQGCSTIIHGTSERISVNSLDPDTVLYVDGAARGKGSASVDIKRGKPSNITAKKKGCQDVTLRTSERFDPTSLLGILLDLGILSIPIDLISGAAWKVEPTTYTLDPICQG